MNIRTTRAIAAFGASIALIASSQWDVGGTRVARSAASSTKDKAADNSMTEAADNAVAEKALAELPVSFVPNAGQADSSVRFMAAGGGHRLALSATEAALTLRGGNKAAPSTVRLGLVGADPDAEVVGEETQQGKVNYLFGNNPARWRTNLPTYAKVTSRAVYPGVDLTWYGQGQQLEYDFVVAPGADPGRITLSVKGAKGMRLDQSGNLLIDAAAGQLRQAAPRLYQEAGSKRQTVDGRFVLKGPDTLAFEVGRYDPARTLVIDPVVSYSTYLGGTSEDTASAIVVDGGGNAYITGATCSSDFPLMAPAQPAFGGDPACDGHGEEANGDAFVTKLKPDGSALVYSTFLGGTETDKARSIAVTSDGRAVVTGFTRSNNFPTSLDAFDNVRNGTPSDSFVARLDPAGLIDYSTFFGGAAADTGVDLALGPEEKVYLAGTTSSTNFPVTPGAFIATWPGGLGRGFFASLNLDAAGNGSGVNDPVTNAAVVYASYSMRAPSSMAVDVAGTFYLAGQTGAGTATTPGSFQPGLHGVGDAYVAKVNPAGQGSADLLYATNLGGELGLSQTPGDGLPNGGIEIAFGVALGPPVAGSTAPTIYLAGRVDTSDFPITTGAFQKRRPGCSTLGCDGFFSVINPDPDDPSGGTGAPDVDDLVYSTYIGGVGSPDQANAVAVDPAGNGVIVGLIFAASFPTKDAVQSVCGCFTMSGFRDAYVIKIRPDPTGTHTTNLLFSTFLGGTGEDAATGVFVTSKNKIYVSGRSAPWAPQEGDPPAKKFPTKVGSFQTKPTGGNNTFDGFVVKITKTRTL